MRWSVTCGALLLLALPAAGADRSVPVSPGSALALALVESRCPTFSWAAVAGAREYELVVYRLGDNGEPEDPELLRRFSGTVSSWTPALDRCFERGGRYAWAIRALADRGDSEWSPASLFEVADPPGAIVLPEAAIPMRHPPATTCATAESSALLDEQSTSRGVPLDLPAESSPSERPTDRAPAVPAALSVTGEVRMVNPDGDPRLWGLGRPGTMLYGTESGLCELSGIFFGLSATMVPWYAAQHACPAGTWVCRPEERGLTACNTQRPDDTRDGYGCDYSFLDWDEDAHKGWVDQTQEEYSAKTRLEKGNSGVSSICAQYPVWCCSEESAP